MNRLPYWARITCLFAVSSLSLFTSSCGEHKSSLSLIPAPPAPADDAELLRKKQLQSVQMLDVETGSYLTTDATSLGLYLFNECAEKLGSEHGTSDYPYCLFETVSGEHSDLCAQNVCTSVAMLCAGKLMRQLATHPGTVIPIYQGGTEPKFRVEPQSTGANAAIMTLASTMVMAAGIGATNALEPMVLGVSTAPADNSSCVTKAAMTATPKSGTSSSLAGIASSVLVESAQLSEELVRDAADVIVASSDAELSSSLSPTLAQGRAFSSPMLSRGHAVRVLDNDDSWIEVEGADSGIEGLPNSSLCSVTELTAQAQHALELLRAAAPPPSDVTDANLSISAFLNEPRATGSIKERLSQFWGRSINGDIEEAMKLGVGDFSAAREYLKQELAVFARSPSKLTTPHVGDKFDRYASTAQPPPARDPAYWGAVTHYRSFFSVPLADPAKLKNPSIYYSNSSFPETRYMFVNWAKRLAANTNNLPAALQPIGDHLALLGSTMQERAPGYVTFQLSESQTSIFVNMASFPTPTSNFAIVRGEDALHCATQGAIEGIPCSTTDISDSTVCPISGAPPFQIGCVDYSVGVNNAASAPRYYVLASKGGGTGPGDYVSLIGASPYVGSEFGGPPVSGQRKVFAIARDIDQKIAEILTPNRNSCSRPRKSCAGADFDERMPLDNELSSTTDDPVESSWKYYLQLARQAATTADQLGSDLIVSNLNVDLRNETTEQRQEQRTQDAEAAIDDLQQACGTNVDPMKLLLALSGTTNPNDLKSIRQRGSTGATVTCTQNSQCDGSSGYQCLNGTCMRNALDPATVLGSTHDASLKDALSRISECIGQDTSAPFVSLGTEPICVWYPNDAPSQVCKSSDREHPCPDFAGTSGCSSMKLPAGFDSTNTTVRLVDRQLGYFSSPQEPQPFQQTCQALNEARPYRHVTDQIEKVVASDIFHPFNIEPLARTIGYSAQLGGGASVTVDGHLFYRPHDTVYKTSQLPWCINCSTDEDWAKLDDRLLRAVVALRGTSINDLRSIYLPFYIEKNRTTTNTPASDPTSINFPGTSVPVRVTDYTTALPDGQNTESDLAHIYQYHSDTTATLPPAWRAPGADGQMQSFGLTLTRDGRNYEFAIGNTAILNDTPSYPNNIFPQGRLSWWAHMSTSKQLEIKGGGYWDAYTSWSEAGQHFAQPAAFLPGVLVFQRICADTDRDIQLFLGGRCEDPADPQVWASNNPCHATPHCQYLDVAMHQPFDYDNESLRDAAELACAISQDTNNLFCDPKAPPQIRHPGDYKKAQAFLGCVSDEIQRRASLTVLANFPERAIDALRKTSATGAYPALGGTVGEDISQLRGALVQVAGIQSKLAYQIKSLGNDFEVLSVALARADLKDEIADTQFQAGLYQQMSNCGAAISGTYTSDVISIPGRAVGAAVTCANSFAQIGFSSTLEDLTQMDSQLDRRLSVAEFRQRFADRALAFQGFADELSTQLELIDSRLASIEKSQQAARQALGRALFKASAVGASEAGITTVQGNIAAVATERYQRANKNAVRLAFLAKRAIENRLGVKLATMTSDLPLVAAPATWEASVCASTGVDYTALKKNASDFKANTFADQYIGDYVTKLESVVESYRLANDFHQGDDTSVISLKDDIFNVRAKCNVASRNRLMRSGQQDQPTSSTGSGWDVSGCATGAGCIAVRRASEAKSPSTDEAEVSAAGVFGITFAAGSSLRQAIHLNAGNYVLSWYGTPSSALSVRLLGGDGNAITPADLLGRTGTIGAANGFQRQYRAFVLTQALDGFVSIDSTTTSEQLVGAVMLEARNDLTPSAYENTAADGTHPVNDCPDTSGDTFRRTRWKHRCVQLCPNGFADSCAGNAATTQCFWETSFAINQRGIEAGDVLNYGGFAKGNFNYRLSDVGLNFIGTGILSCADSASPQTCAASGNIQYSLIHSGPYYVRNHDGQDAKIELFEGHIEHARGLATERFLTNPLSSADASLIEQYTRTEFRGRPLDGNFTLQVWDQKGVDFDAIQDIQLLLKYRYWTRFQ